MPSSLRKLREYASASVEEAVETKLILDSVRIVAVIHPRRCSGITRARRSREFRLSKGREL
jgi:hypothetical protein